MFLDLRRKYLPKNHPDIGTALFNMSGTLVCLGDLRQALDRIREATCIFQAVLPPTHPLCAQARERCFNISTRSVLLDENGDGFKEPGSKGLFMFACVAVNVSAAAAAAALMVDGGSVHVLPKVWEM